MIDTRTSRKLAIAALAALLFAGIGVAYSAPKAGQVITVRVLRAKVMKAPKYIGASVATVSRGEQLTFREARGLWYRVEGGADGWIHKSNVIAKSVRLSSKPGGSEGASSDEVELAGRGFTPQIEGEYRRENPSLDFGHVDAIEQTEIDPGRLEAFVADGEIGGAQ